MDMSLNKLREMVKDWEACRAAVHGVEKDSDMTEQLNNINSYRNGAPLELFPMFIGLLQNQSPAVCLLDLIQGF